MDIESCKKISIKGKKDLVVTTKENLLKSLRDAGIVVEASCGGHGTCGKCKIKIIEGKATDQNGNLVKSDQDGFHLACQIYPLEDLIIDKVQEDGVSTKGEVGGISIEKKHLKPLVKKIHINLVYPKLQHNYSLQEMIFKASGGYKPDHPLALKQLAEMAPQKVKEVTLVLISEKITAIEKGDTRSKIFGVAFDIGTTTVAGMLVDLNKGEVIAATAVSNPQAPFGADVISRIEASSNPEDFSRLTDLIRESLNQLILNLCSKAEISKDHIYFVTIAGNSTMEHLLMGISPQSLTLNPYVTAFNSLGTLSPADLGLKINPGGRVQLLPNIASFVGADTVAAILAVEQDMREDMTLLIDLGTNGELALGNRDKLVVSSTAAGPAFEGAQLSSGMRATPGAIDSITLNEGKITISTIDNARPRGVCGSGVIKVLAELLKVGIINDYGRFVDDPGLVQLPQLIKERLKVKDGMKEFILVFADQSETGIDISITQRDIREIQLVKSSIYTGTQILLESLGMTLDQIKQVLIAGAFGNFIDIDSSLTIGLIPRVRREKIKSVGNAAGAGAAKALMSEFYLSRSFMISEKASFIELANDKKFQDKFIENLSFIKDE